MARVTVVGSGASGVHFALTLLERGHTVEMLDVGRPAPEHELPDASWSDLKARHPDPARYFLGADFQSVVLPGRDGEYYGFPPHKEYVFEGVRQFAARTDGFAPLFSYARGGLAQTWTGGSYPLNDAELDAFPFGYDGLGPHYDTVAGRIGISGRRDDLAAFLPVHAHLQEPLRLDAHGARLLERYERKRDGLNRAGAHMGRARSAVLSEPLGARPGCDYTGRCLWGCPTEAFYTPELTLRECRASDRFTYRDGLYVRRFRYEKGRVVAVVAEPVDGGEPLEVPVETLALAAGTLHSSRILLESVHAETGEAPRLPGLMDNRQVLVPFVTLSMLGRRYDPDTYQYNQLALGLEGDHPAAYVHCQITTLKTALLHPIVQGVPCDLRTALFLFRNLHAALGLVNVNFHDTRRDGNYLTLEQGGPDGAPRLVVRYAPPDDEERRTRRAVGRLAAALRKLGAVRAPGMTHERPMGASVHYAGTVPMSADERPFTTTREGRVHGFENLHLVDGSTFPFLPAKNLTFTLMANATRIAAEAF